MDPPQVWSTAEGQGNGLSYWIEAICEAFLRMSADSTAGRNFSGRLEQQPLGALELNFIEADPQEVWRTRQDIGRSTENHFYVLHIRREQLIVQQRGRQAVVEAGHCVLVDSKEPYHFSFPRGDFCLSTQLPEPWLKTWLPAPEDQVARPWGPSDKGGWGAVLAGALGNLHPDGVDALPLPPSAMADQIGSLLALAGGKTPTSTSHRAAVLRRLRSALHDQFQDATLAPARVARQHDISVRYLHTLFAEAGTTFGTELMAVRLDRASLMLKDPRFGGLSMSEIGWRCGFGDPSHFARLFRRRFGMAPLRYRQAMH